MAKSTRWLVTTLAVASCALWTSSVASAARGPTATAIIKSSQRQLQQQKIRRHLSPVSSQLLIKDLRGGGDRGYGYDNYVDPAADDDDDAYYRGQQGAGRDDYYTERPRGKSTGYRDDDYDEQDYYDGKRSSSSNGRRSKSSSGSGSKKLLQSLPNIIQNGDRRIGLLLLGSGTIVTMMGITLFFQRTLMRLGNLLVIAGIPMTIGPGRTASYFMDPKKTRASVCLAAGIFLVLVAGRPVFGIALELFGLLNLFGNMFPVVLAIAKQMPVIGPLLSGSKNGNSNSNSNNSSRRSNNNSNNNYSRERQRSDNDYYYEGDDGRGQQGGDYYGYEDDRPGNDANADRFY